MGLFTKAKQAGTVYVRGAGPVDPALFGGPSTRPVAEDDAIWQPINGFSLSGPMSPAARVLVGMAREHVAVGGGA